MTATLTENLIETLSSLLTHQARRATKFVSPQYVVSAQRIVWGGRIDRRNRTIDIRIKIGKPNFHERKLIQKFQRIGTKFPIRDIRLARFRR